jgi:hypothetical protein
MSFEKEQIANFFRFEFDTKVSFDRKSDLCFAFSFTTDKKLCNAFQLLLRVFILFVSFLKLKPKYRRSLFKQTWEFLHIYDWWDSLKKLNICYFWGIGRFRGFGFENLTKLQFIENHEMNFISQPVETSNLPFAGVYHMQQYQVNISCQIIY